MDGVQLPQGLSHFEEAVYFLPLSPRKFPESTFFWGRPNKKKIKWDSSIQSIQIQNQKMF